MKGMLQTVKRKLSANGEHLNTAYMSDRLDNEAGVTGTKATTTSGGNNVLGVGTSTPLTGEVARSDLALPKRERRRSFTARNQKIQALKDLPHLKDTSSQKREVYFLHP